MSGNSGSVCDYVCCRSSNEEGPVYSVPIKNKTGDKKVRTTILLVVETQKSSVYNTQW